MDALNPVATAHGDSREQAQQGPLPSALAKQLLAKFQNRTVVRIKTGLLCGKVTCSSHYPERRGYVQTVTQQAERRTSGSDPEQIHREGAEREPGGGYARTESQPVLRVGEAV